MSPVVLRGGVLDRLTSFAACRNLIFFSRCRRIYRVVGTVPYPLLFSWSSLDCVSLFATYRDLIIRCQPTCRALGDCYRVACYLRGGCLDHLRFVETCRNVLYQLSTFLLSAWRVLPCYPLPALWCLANLRVVGTCRNLIRLLSETCRARGDCSSCYLIPVWG